MESKEIRSAQAKVRWAERNSAAMTAARRQAYFAIKPGDFASVRVANAAVDAMAAADAELYHARQRLGRLFGN